MQRSPGPTTAMSQTRRVTRRRKTAGPPSAFIHLFSIVLILTFMGVVFCFIIVPEELQAETNSHSFHTFTLEYGASSAKKLSRKILEWIPKHHRETVVTGGGGHTDGFQEPDWDVDFWTPIDVEVSKSPATTMLTMCHLNFREYSQNPHLYPMFKDLTGLSHCNGANRKRQTLQGALDELKMKQEKGGALGKVLKPNGFVFHESRVGSTLVANTFASDPFSMVFSESTPPANALLHCTGCSREQQIKLFQDVVTLMGNSPIHRHLFFKFQSITSTKMDIALEAFPDTPFAFVYRDSIQTMMSHLDPRKSTNGAPCLRSKRSPPSIVKSAVEKETGSYGKAPNEAWCAAHLRMLCESALESYNKFGVTATEEGHVKQRGIMINYESLPGIIPRVILPLFGTETTAAWLHKMRQESKQYSKGRSSGSRLFKGDSEDKETHATTAIARFAKNILDPSYEKLMAISEESLRAIRPIEFQNMILTAEEGDGSLRKRNWKYLSNIPEFTEMETNMGRQPPADTTQYHQITQLSASTASVGNVTSLRGASSSTGVSAHSRALDKNDFVAWSPFSNTHSSRSFHVIDCPELPLDGYPMAYPIPDIVTNWNPDNTEIPSFHHDSLCHFDHANETQLAYAMNYRRAEVPFVVYNIPEVDEVVKKWNNLDYLQRKLGYKKYRIETSETNHFMYWNSGGASRSKAKLKDWKQPTKMSSTTFEEWMEVAVRGQNVSLNDRKHEYFRVSSDMGSPWLYDELPFFKPEKSLFMVQPTEQRGIHCRFGMRSVIAEAHFDGSRNAVVEIGGMRRWILAHPNQCKNMHMLPHGHPSGRHSEVDWSNPDTEKFPNFKKLRGNEVILQPGDFLYVPTYWIHYIVSLNVNFQCNTRSGRSSEYDQFIRTCGF